jgi:hypothetical protein
MKAESTRGESRECPPKKDADLFVVLCCIISFKDQRTTAEVGCASRAFWFSQFYSVQPGRANLGFWE